MSPSLEKKPSEYIREAFLRKQAAAPDYIKPVEGVTLANLFEHAESHPYILDLALLQKYGPVWMEWENQTLEIAIPRDFGGQKLSDLNLHKLNAMKCIHVVDTFWEKWEVFSICTATLNGAFPDFEVMYVPTVEECAVAVDIAERVTGRVPWSEEMRAYLATVHEYDGIFCPIPPFEDIEVDSESYDVDCAAVSKLWPVVRKTRKSPTEETPEAEQLKRMLDVLEGIEEHRVNLEHQMKLLIYA